MRIAYIAAGAGGMYCGSCIHDNTLAAALQGLGHDVALLPTYTPLRTDEDDVSDPRLFYGALNVYLQQKLGFFRRAPRFLDRLLDRRGLLAWVSRLGASTDPRGLGDLTLEVLRGESGAQRKELDKLVEWLAGEYRPDVVVLTNSLLLGLARRIRAALGVPLLVSVQGEDLFIGQLPEQARGEVVAELRRRAADADLFLAPSRYYAEHMSRLLDVDRERLRVVPLGIHLAGHGGAPESSPASTVTLGFLARICHDKGLHRLVDAFLALAPARPALRLRVAGYLGPRDRRYWEEQRRRVAAAGLAERVDFVGEVDRAGKIRFLQSLDVLCVPTVYREPKGLFALEAMANGVPVVLPAHGSFPEMIEETGGGLLYDADSPVELVGALARLLDDAAERRRLGARGEASVHARRGARAMAEQTAAVLAEALATAGARP